MGGKSIKLFSDSRLVVGQVRGEFEAKDERILVAKYAERGSGIRQKV